MGDFDDMNATPLGKLPAPVMQSKNDGPQVDMSTSYGDILKEMQRPQQPPQQQAPQGGSAFAPPQPPPQQQQLHASSFMAPMQQAPQMYHHQQQQLYDDGPMPAPPARARSRKREKYLLDDDEDDEALLLDPRVYGKSKKSKKFVHSLAEYKTSILVTIIVFFLMWYVAPKLASIAPQLLLPSGKFGPLGLFILAAMTGGIHRVADYYVPG